MLKKEFLDKVAENAGLYKYQAYMVGILVISQKSKTSF